MTTLDDRPRGARLWVVFFIGLSVIALEVVSFQALSFVNDYLTATRVLSIALLGIAVGGLLSFWATKAAERAQIAALVVLPLSILLSLFAIARLNPSPVLLMVVLTVPYIAASVSLSLWFNSANPGRVYLYDLAGAGVGALSVVFLVPLLREEGSFIVIAGLAAAPLFLQARATGARRARTAALGIAGLCGVLLIAHITIDPFNLMLRATVDRAKFPRKIFHELRTSDGLELFMSRGSLIERIDIVASGRRSDGKTKSWFSVYNGRVVDIIDRAVAREGWLDNRLPTLLRLGEDPDTLLVGPSGQGLTKAVQSLGRGHIDAVEINGAIAGIMTGRMYRRSGRAYRGMALTVGDVRTFLERTDRTYDFITLLNTHRIWSLGHQGPPEYIHTVEAMRAYFAHLKERGFVLFEERNINERSDLGIRRVIATAKQVMREIGISDPSKHFAIWELYHHCYKRGVEAIPSPCERSYLFTFVMIKRTPITDAEYAHFLEWAEMLGARPDKGMGYRGIVWRYLPQQPTEHYWTQVVERDDVYATDGVDRTRHVLEPVTDDRPFPWEVYRAPGEAHEVLGQTALLALIMVALPALVTFFAGRREPRSPDSDGSRERREARWANVLLLPFFAVLGLGYLVIEVVLIQKLGIFLSSPAYSLAIVLSSMLVASGFGGYVSRRAGGLRCLAALAAVALYSVFIAFAIDGVVGALMFLPFALRALAAVALVAPVGFAMGIPFPHAIAVAKRALSERHAGLYFGINGAIGATAAPLALIWSMERGFAQTALLGGATYAICLVLLAPLVVMGRAGRRRDSGERTA